MDTDPARLPHRVQDLLQDHNNDVYVSAATAWEIAIKSGSGRRAFNRQFMIDFDASVRALAFEPLPIVSRHAVEAAMLPGDHRDPFDRMLVAQARVEGLTLATSDRQIAGLGAPVVW